MRNAVAVDESSTEPPPTLRAVPCSPAPVGLAPAELAERLAHALRAVRGYVPHRIWWEAGPAEALIAFNALQTESPAAALPRSQPPPASAVIRRS